MTGHRVPLAEGWDLWRLVAVRGAGFPASGLERLGAAAAAAAAAGHPAGAAEYREALAAGLESAAAAVDAIAADPRFQEAVLWQNRHAARDGLRVGGGGVSRASRNRRRRRFESIVARYWTRYCGKNDTIGFFGPIGWGSVDPRADASSARPGPALVAHRIVGFETWAVEALADALIQAGHLATWLAPALSPELSLDGSLLRRPGQPPLRLTAAEAALVARCDGRTAARLLAGGGSREADVYAQLESLRDRGIVRWDAGLPNEPGAERVLRERLEAVGDPALREGSLAALQSLGRARDHVAEARGPLELDARLGELEDTLASVTGTAAVTREDGQTYGGRTPLYLDCRRDLELVVGRDVLSAMEGPLTLLLDASRWLTWETRRAYEAALGELYRELAAEAGSPRVELSDLWFYARGLLFGSGPRPVDAVLSEFRERWDRLLGLGPAAGTAEVRRSAAELRPAVREAFSAPGPGWPAARYHSPDVQVAAASLDELRAGRFDLVLGEMHSAWNATDVVALLGEHPDPASLLPGVEADVPETRVVPLVPRDWPRETVRLHPLLRRPRDLLLAFASLPDRPPAERLVPITALVVEEVGGSLRARGRDGRPDMDLVDLLGHFLSIAVVDGFRTVTHGAPRPRVSIDRMTVIRRSWAFSRKQLGFTALVDEADLFWHARRWAAEAGLPRFVFVHVPGELKPFFVDLESPISVSVLTTFVRAGRDAAGDVTVVEMLPRPDQCWLPDAAGARYASELRLVAVDTTR